MANLMKSIKSKLLILAFLLLTSCGVQWQVSTLNHTAHDPLYSDFVRQHSEKIDTLSTSQFRWKFQNDFRFRSDWKRFAQNQSYSWWSDYYWKNRLWRLGWSSSHQLYVNSFNYLYFNEFWSPEPQYPWFDWWHPHNVRHHRYWGFYYDHPFGWYINNHWSYNYYTEPLYASNNNYVLVNGRRGSNNSYFNSNIEQDTNRRRGIRNYPNPNRNIVIPDEIINNMRNRGINVIVNPKDGTNIFKPIRGNGRIINNSIDTNVRPVRPNFNNNGWNRPDTNISRPRYNNNVNNSGLEQNTRINYNSNRSGNARSTNSNSNGRNQNNKR